MTELPDINATALRALIAKKDISPRELLEACLARIDEIDPAVNAITAMCVERARSEADAAGKAVLAGDQLGLLHGLPLGVKDLSETAGLRTTFGSLIYADHVPARDEAMVASVRKAGGIVVAKTNTPEFGAGAITDNAVFGPTGNPFDPTRTCGGSSGGSAVALAASMLPLCTGADSGGSLRIPAAFCGVVGFRPTPGLVPGERRLLGWTPTITSGPMARTVEDAVLLLRAQIGWDARDPLSCPIDATRFDELEEIDLGKLRVAVSEDLGSAAVDQIIRATLRERVGLISGAFGACIWQDPDMSGADEAFAGLRAQNYLAAHAERYAKHRDKLGRNVIANYEEGLSQTAQDVARAHALQTKIYRAMCAFFQDVDLLISPTVSVPPFPLTQEHPTEIDGRALPSYFSWLAPTYYLSLVGFPCLSLPCGVDATGMPFALQITGGPHQDAFVLAAALAIERKLQENALTRRPVPDLARLRNATTPLKGRSSPDRR